jgi:hypothetical protein
MLLNGKEKQKKKNKKTFTQSGLSVYTKRPSLFRRVSAAHPAIIRFNLVPASGIEPLTSGL